MNDPNTHRGHRGLCRIDRGPCMDDLDTCPVEPMTSYSSGSGSGINHGFGSSALVALGGFVVGAVVTWVWTQYWGQSVMTADEQQALLKSSPRDWYQSTKSTRTPSVRTVAPAATAVSSDSFLADMLSALWKQVNAVATTEIQTAVEPMFADLPSPFSTLRFTKVCLGHVPLRLENIVVQKDDDGVQFNVDVVWDGECDIQMKADYIGSLGVKSIKLAGRMSVVLQPLLNVSPIVGAVQYAFVETPHLELDFTGMAQVADIKSIKTTIVSTILESINAVMVLPKRTILRMVEGELAPTLAQLYRPPLGIARLVLVHGHGFETEQRSVLRNDVRDVYCKITVAQQAVWTSAVVPNAVQPEWNETSDYLVYDRDQQVHIAAMDRDDGTLDLDDLLGDATVTLGELLAPSTSDDDQGRRTDVVLWHHNQPTCATVTLRCELLPLVDTLDSLSAPLVSGRPTICGVLTILVCQAFDLPVSDEVTTEQSSTPPMDTYVNVSFGSTTFVAPAVTGGRHPLYDGEFHVPIMSDMLVDQLPPVVLTLMQTIPGRSDSQLGIVHVASASLWAQRVAGRQALSDTTTSTLDVSVSLHGIGTATLPAIAAPALSEVSVASALGDSEEGDALAVANGWGV